MKQVTYTGTAPPAGPFTAVHVEVDGKTHELPLGLAVSVPETVAERLAADDLKHHDFEIADAPTARRPKTQKGETVSPADPSGPAGGNP